MVQFVSLNSQLCESHEFNKKNKHTSKQKQQESERADRSLYQLVAWLTLTLAGNSPNSLSSSGSLCRSAVSFRIVIIAGKSNKFISTKNGIELKNDEKVNGIETNSNYD